MLGTIALFLSFILLLLLHGIDCDYLLDIEL
ncbi:hypothetical protein P775_22070 [Puniceibacterium antarcticum]|uniref:Uncharacterized protein n=1 Tax=Puniceibacterium antarcticum TaxID=1206336 RepID=A0A2G8RA19_9RHOB|nr:hypothetical protein P775_22070 [Puniceibacterium antarcticum]